jgi:hypothetical protein
MTITVDDATRALLDELNERTGAAKSEIIRRGVRLYAASLERPAMAGRKTRQKRKS